MMTVLEESLLDSDIAVCVKDAGKTVLMQNERCRAICGEKREEVCEVGCMELYAADSAAQWQNWGSRVYKNSLISGRAFDVTLLCSNNRLITFLQPLDEQYAAAFEFYRGKGLSKRETEVIALTIQGASNANICERLSISKATLRTHLNNFYKKLRDQGEEPRFIPGVRATSVPLQ